LLARLNGCIIIAIDNLHAERGDTKMASSDSTENQKDDTRTRILKAARELFAEVGYARATTRLIANRAGVNEVTLFRQFGNKKALLMACVEYINAANITSHFEDFLSGDYPKDIYRMAQRQISEMQANVELLRMLLCEVRNVPELREVLLEGGRGNQERMSHYFNRLVDTSVIREGLTPETLSIAFESLFSWSVLFENVFQENPSQMTMDELINPLVDIFVKGTRRAE
jgi:AcrR family transcriptional regulator